MAQSSQTSPMSITQLCNSTSESENQTEHNGLDHTDPDVRLAAEALGDMANSKAVPITLPPLSTYPSAPSTTPSSPLPTPTSSSLSNSRFSFSSDSSITSQEDDFVKHPRHPQRHFVHRMSDLPIVNSALRAYESTKQSNGVVKYGVEMVESFAQPIYDKFGRRGSESSEMDRYSDQEDEAALAAASALARASLTDNYEPHREGIRRRRTDDPRDELPGKKPRSRSSSRSTSPHRPYTLTKSPTPRHTAQPIPRSRWQQIVMHAGSAAGTTAAVISEESMKCLRYCLSWLQYASRHIEQQMDILRNFLVSLAAGSAAEKGKSRAVAVPSASSTLSAVKKEIVDTLRKVVDVVSKYAGSGLPEQAKASVRKFILALPSRWATLNTSTTASPAASPALGPHAPARVHETSIKLLSFGDESIEMLQSVATVFSDTIERAELWLQRLRVVGVAGPQSSRRQPKQQQDQPMEMTEPKDHPKQMVSTDDMDTS
ncbi:transcription factor Opi1-domain-containing protein [Fennellomyces sp. T-0311]|nr:transcription factor Opi1-domain-containing protein [Fennellomyces sp. T-0311]